MPVKQVNESSLGTELQCAGNFWEDAQPRPTSRDNLAHLPVLHLSRFPRGEAGVSQGSSETEDQEVLQLPAHRATACHAPTIPWDQPSEPRKRHPSAQ